MNLYLRYFDSEILVTNVEDAWSFLASIPEIGFNNRIAEDVRAYFVSDNRFPKRYKVRPKIYFIMIKTDANNMKEFKDYRLNSISKANETSDTPEFEPVQYGTASSFMNNEPYYDGGYMSLHTQRFGWYEGEFCFKRVVTSMTTGKHEYRDTRFVAQCKAMSGIDCYNRIVEHLRGRVDERSQFPSAKGKNFSFVYLGDAKEV